MSQPKFTGVWIPSAVFSHKGISMTAKVVYGVIDGLDNDDGCFASNAYLSEHLGLCERQLRNILKELDDANLIARTEIGGRRVIRTVEKIALAQAIGGGEEIYCHGGRKNIAMGGGNKLPPYSKEDNKEDNKEPPTPLQGGGKEIEQKTLVEFNDGGRAWVSPKNPLAKAKKQSVIPDLNDIPWSEPPPFDSKAFSEAWTALVSHLEDKASQKAILTGKKAKKNLNRVTDAQTIALWTQFKEWGEERSIYNIRNSVMRGYSSVYDLWSNPIKNNLTSGITPKILTAEDHSKLD